MTTLKFCSILGKHVYSSLLLWLVSDPRNSWGTYTKKFNLESINVCGTLADARRSCVRE